MSNFSAGLWHKTVSWSLPQCTHSLLWLTTVERCPGVGGDGGDGTICGYYPGGAFGGDVVVEDIMASYCEWKEPFYVRKECTISSSQTYLSVYGFQLFNVLHASNVLRYH